MSSGKNDPAISPAHDRAGLRFGAAFAGHAMGQARV
jgi:hypothetical protein